MQGTSGTYAFNGVALNAMPTSAKWVDRPSLGISGEGRHQYPAIREFEFTWEYLSMAEYNQIQGLYNSVSSTGTIVVDLPKFATTPYQFYSYSGCTIKEPTVDAFFETYVSKVTMSVLRIRGT